MGPDLAKLGKAVRLDERCFQLEFTNSVQHSLQLDNPVVVLETRAVTDLWGVFYSAKGLEWDVWSDSAQEAQLRDVEFAFQRPLEAGYRLLSNCPRPDFNYVPEDE